MSLVGHGTATRNSSASVSQAVKPAKMLYQLCAGCLRMHPKCACPMAHSNGKLWCKKNICSLKAKIGPWQHCHRLSNIVLKASTKKVHLAVSSFAHAISGLRSKLSKIHPSIIPSEQKKTQQEKKDWALHPSAPAEGFLSRKLRRVRSNNAMAFTFHLMQPSPSRRYMDTEVDIPSNTEGASSWELARL